MWLRLPVVLLAVHTMSFVDSDLDPKMTNFIVNECVIPVLKSKLNDMCYLDHMALEFCNVNTELGHGCDK